MPVPDQTRPAELLAVVEHGVRTGRDLRLVQGAGGNFSVKHDDVLWIKASGTRLVEGADREIYVPMQLAATREAVLVTEDLAGLVLPDAATAGLRPSIETALHALLPHRVVFHVHGVGSIAAGLTDAAAGAAARLPADWDVVVVPYAKPGIELARAVLAGTPSTLSADRPLVLVLRNHGLVVGASGADEAAAVVAAVEEAFRAGGPAPAPSVDAAPDQLFPAGTVDDDAAGVLCAGALTPDSAVFLGPAPFARSVEAAPPPADAEHSGHVAADGSVWLRPDLGPDEREVAASLVDVARLASGRTVSTLTAGQVAELVDWEAEKWRRQQKR